MKLKTLKDYGKFEVEHEENHIGILNVGHNQRIAVFNGRQVEEFKLEQAEFLVEAANNYQKTLQILTDIVHANTTNMGTKAKQLRIDIAKDFLRNL